ncbi:unnamed protein product [Heligmosomoides polygyrus]|uniref:Secreted protein n=1 Tax=Heligmosomoides polygyrus TaxID=6339 RepID=A0A183G3S0_HELPZ|nr:unnamed protein product [Heligmosomoides polygyrus]
MMTLNALILLNRGSAQNQARQETPGCDPSELPVWKLLSSSGGESAVAFCRIAYSWKMRTEHEKNCVDVKTHRIGTSHLESTQENRALDLIRMNQCNIHCTRNRLRAGVQETDAHRSNAVVDADEVHVCGASNKCTPIPTCSYATHLFRST